MKNFILAFVLSVPLAFAAGTGPASATPFSAASGLASAVPDDLVQDAHWRRYRHCHSVRRGRIWCHGGYRPRPRRCVRVPVRHCRPYGRCITRWVVRCYRR